MLAIQMAMSHCMVRTRHPNDWDEGDSNFVHVMHNHIFVYCDVFPMYFVTNHNNMRNVWYRLQKSPAICMCLKGLVPIVSQDIVLNMDRGYKTIPVNRNEFKKIVKRMDFIESENKVLKEKLERQQR